MVRRRANRRRANTRSRRIVKRAFSAYSKGKFIRLSSDPSVIPFTTWWPVTVLFYFSGNLTFTPASVFTKLRSQIDGLAIDTTADTFWCNIRFVSVRAWGKSVPLDLRIHDIQGDDSVFKSSGDLPGQIAFSRVGYVFGSVENQNVYGTNDSNKVFEIVSIKGGQCMAYVSILIRFRAMDNAIKGSFWDKSQVSMDLMQ